MSSAINLLSPPGSRSAASSARSSPTAPSTALLEQELADYTSEKDLADLGAILDRHSDAETGDIRRILGARQAGARGNEGAAS